MFVGPWHILEEPALGVATLTLAIRNNGRLIVWDEFEENESSSQSATQDSSKSFPDIFFQIPLLLEATPWNGDGVRPFACDYFPPALVQDDSKRGAPAVSMGGTLVLALSREVKLDHSRYLAEKMKFAAAKFRNHPDLADLELLIIRVDDPTVLPDLGEPLLYDQLLPTSQWIVLSAILDDLEKQQMFSTTSGSTREILHSIRSDLISGVVVIERQPCTVLFSFKTEGSQCLIQLTLSDSDPSAIAWELLSPIKTEDKSKIYLRITRSKNVVVKYELRRERVPRTQNTNAPVEDEQMLLALDPMLLFIKTVDDIKDVPPQNSPLEEKGFDILNPTRSYTDLFDQVSQSMKRTFINSFLESPGILALPLLFVNPQVAVVGILLGAVLSLAGLYYTINERSYILKYGVNRFGQPRSRDEIDLALALSIFGLVLDAASAVAATAQIARASLAAMTQVDQALIRRLAQNAPTPLRIALRKLQPRVLAFLINKAARLQNPKALLQAYAEVVHRGPLKTSPFLLDIELQQVFTRDYLWFRVPELKTAYMQYVRDKQKRFAKLWKTFPELQTQYKIYTANEAKELEKLAPGFTHAEIDNPFRYASPLDWLRTTGQKDANQILKQHLGKSWRKKISIGEPLQWVTISRQPAVKKMLTELLGSDWVEKIQIFSRYVPLQSHVQEMLEFLARPLPYNVAKQLRFTPGRDYGRMIELDHLPERRLVEALALKKGMKEADLSNYETAMVFAVPKNYRVARRIPGYTGYAHYSKTRRMEVLIAYGRESEYTFQQMRDAEVFTVASLAGADSSAIALIDASYALIAGKTGEAIKLGTIPTKEQFQFGTWKYFLPSHTHGMNLDEYLYQLEPLMKELEF